MDGARGMPKDSERVKALHDVCKVVQKNFRHLVMQGLVTLQAHARQAHAGPGQHLLILSRLPTKMTGPCQMVRTLCWGANRHAPAGMSEPCCQSHAHARPNAWHHAAVFEAVRPPSSALASGQGAKDMSCTPQLWPLPCRPSTSCMLATSCTAS